jgi:hypothetical protein
VPVISALNVMRQSRLLEFSSSAFTVELGEDEHTNLGRFGRSLSRWIASKLSQKGVPTGEVIPEDFGWCIPVQSAPHRLYVACANIADEPNRWRVFAFAEGGLMARLIGKDKSAESVASLFFEIKQILQASSEIQNLREEAA